MLFAQHPNYNTTHLCGISVYTTQCPVLSSIQQNLVPKFLALFDQTQQTTDICRHDYVKIALLIVMLSRPRPFFVEHMFHFEFAAEMFFLLIQHFYKHEHRFLSLIPYSMPAGRHFANRYIAQHIRNVVYQH